MVYSSNIADGTIQSVDVKDDALQSRDVRNGTLTLADINDTAEVNLRGQQGIQGIQGEPGTDGEDGIDGVTGYHVVLGPETFAAFNASIDAFAVCPAGKKPLSGGWLSGANNLPLDVKETHPRTLAENEAPASPAGGEAWQVSARQVWSLNASEANWYLRAWAVCATVS